jgi:hypothetical protein
MQSLSLALAVTGVLVGVVWLAQWYLYPRFMTVAEAAFSGYHYRHVRRIVPLTAPLMLLEMALLLDWWLAAGRPLAGLVPAMLLGCVWGNTFLLQVPRHRLLAGGRDEGVITRLIRANRYRALAWTLYWAWLWAGRPLG